MQPAGQSTRVPEGALGVSLLVVFFSFGTLICAAVVFALLVPGSFLEPM
jgi:hypothetical protein